MPRRACNAIDLVGMAPGRGLRALVLIRGSRGRFGIPLSQLEVTVGRCQDARGGPGPGGPGSSRALGACGTGINKCCLAAALLVVMPRSAKRVCMPMRRVS